MYRGIKIKKNFFRIFISLCFCALLSQNAFCYTLTSNELNKTVYNKIDSETKKYLHDVEYKINIQGALNDISYDGTEAPIIEISSQEGFKPVSYRRLIIKDSKGNIIKTFPLNVKISIYKDVLVASDNIRFGESLNSTNTKIEKRDISRFYDKAIAQIQPDFIASKNIIKGSVIQKNSIKQKAIIEKNQNVDIVFIGRGIQVGLKGKALNEGAQGDTILVRSEKYNKTYSAKIDSDSRVTVRI